MKKTFLPLAIMGIASLMTSCKKSADTSINQVTIDTALAAGTTYQLNLGIYGKTASITKQASVFKTSAITSGPVYTYSTDLKTFKNEQVVIGVSNAKTGRNCEAYDSTIVTLNLQVK